MAIATGTAILGAGALALGGSVIGGMMGSKASSNAAATQAGAQDRSTQMQLEFLRETRADIADAVDKGLVDLDIGFNAAIRELMPMASTVELNQAKELLSNPEAIMNRPSTRFQFAQGIEALQAAFSKTGGGGLSGRALQGATEFGQNFASMNLDAELQRLQPLIDIGIGAKTNIANLQQGKGVAKSGLRVAGATGSGNITGQMIPAISQGITNQGTISATNSINQANIANSMIQGATSNVNSMAALYAMRPELFKN